MLIAWMRFWQWVNKWQHRALSTHHSFVTLGVTAGSLLFLLLALDHSGTLRILRTLGVPRSQTLPPPLVRHFLGRYLNWNRRESAGGRAAWDNFLGAVWCGHARSIGRTQSKRGNSPTEVVFFPTHVIVTYIRIESFNLTDIAAFLVFLGVLTEKLGLNTIHLFHADYNRVSELYTG